MLIAWALVASCTRIPEPPPTSQSPNQPTPRASPSEANEPIAAPQGTPAIPVVDSVEIETVVDNFYDFFQKDKDDKTAKRWLLTNADSFEDVRLQAEMGLAYVITAKVGNKEHVILMDFGLSPSVYENNLKHLHLDISKAEALVLSHGHQDHYGGIYLASKTVKAPLYVGGEDVFAHRVLQTPKKIVDFGTLDRDALAKMTTKIIIAKQPQVVAGVALTTGEIPRLTPYEKVPPAMKMEKKGQLVPDPITHEQALIFNVRGRGLVVITSCAHAGVVNTIEYAKKLTKENRILAALGGMHLTMAPDDVIDSTVAAVKAIKPKFVSPMHCTGQRAVAKFQSEMPDAYIHQSVGTRYVFEAEPASTKPDR